MSKNPLLHTLIAMTGQDNVITVHRPFVEFTGTLEAAMMLSQLLYWTPKATIPGGWIAKSDKDWKRELCLTRYGHRSATKTLLGMAIIEVMVKKFNGSPTRHYRVLWDALEIKWIDWVGSSENGRTESAKSDEPSSENERSLTETTPEITQESLGADAPAQGMINPNSGNRTDAKVLGDPMDGILAAERAAATRNAELDNRVMAFPPDCQTTLRTLISSFNWPASVIPEEPKSKKGGTFAQWINEIREINTLVGDFGQDGVKVAVKACADLTISHPAGITWAIAGELGKLAARPKIQQAGHPQTPFALALKNTTSVADDERIKSMGLKLKQRVK